MERSDGLNQSIYRYLQTNSAEEIENWEFWIMAKNLF
jgi:hypothetical protein